MGISIVAADLKHVTALLPAWVVWGPVVLQPVLAGLWFWSMFAVATACIQRSLQPTKNAHWVERARALYPYRLAPTLLAWFALAALWIFRTGYSHTFLVDSTLAAWIPPVLIVGCITLLQFRMHRALFDEPNSWRAYWGSILLWILLFFPILPLLLIVYQLMPVTLDWRSNAVWFGATLFLAMLASIALPWLGTRLQIGFRRADSAVQTIVDQAAAELGILPPRAFVFHVRSANAFAFPLFRAVAFSPLLLQHLDAPELRAIARHELGHVQESRAVQWSRMLLAFLLYVPAICSILLQAVLAWYWNLVFVLLATLGITWLIGQLQQRWERAADAIATRGPAVASAYARALESIYRLNLTPAVIGGRLRTHPELYDRMIAAGVTPEYPRPQPPQHRKHRNMLVLAYVWVVALQVLPILPSWLIDNRRVAALTDMTLFGARAWNFLELGYAVQSREGPLTTALRYYQTAAQLAPHDPDPPLYVVQAAAQLGECGVARAAWEDTQRLMHAHVPLSQYTLNVRDSAQAALTAFCATVLRDLSIR